MASVLGGDDAQSVRAQLSPQDSLRAAGSTLPERIRCKNTHEADASDKWFISFHKRISMHVMKWIYHNVHKA